MLNGTRRNVYVAQRQMLRSFPNLRAFVCSFVRPIRFVHVSIDGIFFLSRTDKEASFFNEITRTRWSTHLQPKDKFHSLFVQTMARLKEASANLFSLSPFSLLEFLFDVCELVCMCVCVYFSVDRSFVRSSSILNMVEKHTINQVP